MEFATNPTLIQTLSSKTFTSRVHLRSHNFWHTKDSTVPQWYKQLQL